MQLVDRESMANDNLQSWASATTIAVTVLAFVAVCLRLLARYERKQKLWWDDWMIIWSMGWNFVVVGFIFAMIKNGMGIHADQVPPENIVLIAKFLLVAEILYVFNLVWTKLSILLMYYRIFKFPFFKLWAYLIGSFVVAWLICITFLFIFICVPVQKVWAPQMPGRCINQVATWIANAASTILTDLAILLLPLPQIWKLQLRFAEKVALTVAFCLGFFVVFASAYRFTVLFSYTALDSSYTLAPTVGWTAIEMSAGIVSACLPTMLPAFQFFTRLLGCQALMPSIFRTHSQTADPKSASRTDHSHGISTTASENGPAQVNRHSFYYLPGDSDELGTHTHCGQGNSTSASGAGGGRTSPRDISFRPKYDDSQTVTDVRGLSRVGEVGDEDEIPLRGIRVQKEFSQVGS